MSTPLPRSVRLLLAAVAFPAACGLLSPPDRARAAPASAPAAAPAADGAMMVVVAEVKGVVQISTDGQKTWTAAKPGMQVGAGAFFRTGFRSSVTCVIPPDQQFTLESLGVVQVAEAAKAGKRVKTDLVMKYGATNYSIEAGGAEHESTIRTPGSTLSVRGTIVRVTDRPGFAPTAESFTGRAFYKTARTATYLGRKGGTYARASAAQPDSAQNALGQTVVDPSTSLARTNTDARLIAQQTSLGALASFNTRENITVITGGAGPLSDAALPSTLVGSVEFVLRWTGNANLNLLVTDQGLTAADLARGQKVNSYLNPAPTQPLTPVELGQISITFNSREGVTPPLRPVSQGFQPTELLYPGFGLNVSASGGTIPYDHQGGPKGGMEIAYWPANAPQGIYGISALHESGAPANYQINAYQNGKPLNLFFVDNPNSDTPKAARGTVYGGTLTGSTNDYSAALALYPANSYFDTLPTVTTVNTPSLFGGTAAAAAPAAPASPAHSTAAPVRPAHSAAGRPAPAARPAVSSPPVSSPALAPRPSGGGRGR